MRIAAEWPPCRIEKIGAPAMPHADLLARYLLQICSENVTAGGAQKASDAPVFGRRGSQRSVELER